jgi:hypothetical protein
MVVAVMLRWALLQHSFVRLGRSTIGIASDINCSGLCRGGGDAHQLSM